MIIKVMNLRKDDPPRLVAVFNFNKTSVYPGLRIPGLPVTHEGLVWFPILKMVHNPGGDEPASWVGG